MKLDNYLSRKNLDILNSNYEEFYLNLLDMNNFDKIYNLLKDNGFEEIIEDIILHYIELFEIDSIYVELAIKELEEDLGDDYVEQIKKDLRLFQKVLTSSFEYSEVE